MSARFKKFVNSIAELVHKMRIVL